MDAETMLKLIDEDRRHVVSPNFRCEVTPFVVRWCSIIEKEIKIKYSAVPETELEPVIAVEVERSRERGCTLEWQAYGHDQPGALSQALEAAGFRKGETGAFMVLDASQNLKSAAHDLNVRQIREPIDLVDYERVLRLAWGGRDFSEHRVFLETYLKRWPAHLALFVGYAAGAAVACGRVVLNPAAHFAHLAGGATIPEHRRRGYYSRLVATRAEAARFSSARFLTVTASPASEPILSKLGFRTVTTMTPWQIEKTA